MFGDLVLPYAPFPPTVQPEPAEPGTVYSWALNNIWDTNFPAQQQGETTFRYAIASRPGADPRALGAAAAAGLTDPFVAAPVTGGAGHRSRRPKRPVGRGRPPAGAGRRRSGRRGAATTSSSTSPSTAAEAVDRAAAACPALTRRHGGHQPGTRPAAAGRRATAPCRVPVPAGGFVAVSRRPAGGLSRDEDRRHPGDHRDRAARGAAAARQRRALGPVRPHHRRGRDRRRPDRPRRDGRRRRERRGRRRAGCATTSSATTRSRSRRCGSKIANPTASLYNNRTQLLAAIEFACLDLIGQQLDVPVHDLLGGKLRDAGAVRLATCSSGTPNAARRRRGAHRRAAGRRTRWR